LTAKKLHIVHCVDTEGPLYESLTATFERLEQAFGISLPPSREILSRIQKGTYPLEGHEEAAMQMFAPHLLSLNDDWRKIDDMLLEMRSPEFRKEYCDSFGKGWKFNWFVMDHVGFDTNPRRRDIGYHNIFDHYQSMIRDEPTGGDEINWHFHPMSTHREAQICATSYLNSPHLMESLVRRVIDKNWFPTSFRAGFHTERPDSHWFLEQWIPFDFSNQATSFHNTVTPKQDLPGRFGDWRRAPNDWSHYHPSHDDYQNPGHCRRLIFRCLNVGTRIRILTQDEVNSAFARAANGKETVLAFCNHDFRDMRADVKHVHQLLLNASRQYPEVTWQHSGAKESAQSVLPVEAQSTHFQLDVQLEDSKSLLTVKSNQKSFGPQPFLAIKTHDKRYITDNFDVQQPRYEWSYTFDRHSIKLQSVEAVGVAFTTPHGKCKVVTISPSGEVNKDSYYP